MDDPNCTESILISIAFFLLCLRSQFEDIQGTTEDVLQKLFGFCNLPIDLQWVCYFLFILKFIIFIFRGMKNMLAISYWQKKYCHKILRSIRKGKKKIHFHNKKKQKLLLHLYYLLQLQYLVYHFWLLFGVGVVGDEWSWKRKYFNIIE